MTGKYDTKEINGTLCAIVEQGINLERASFLKDVLEHNGYVVEILENPVVTPAVAGEGEASELPAPTYTIGVTDITFNISLELFSRRLKTLADDVLLPNYWLTGKKGEENYWKEPGVVVA